VIGLKKMTNRFMFKMLKARLKLSLTKTRGIKSYKKKKAILLIFLVVVNIFILNDVIEKGKLIDLKTIIIIERVAESVTANVAEAKTEDSQGGVGGDTLPSSTKELSVEDKICKEFAEDCKIMIAIATAESGLNPKAINDKNTNGTTDAGLFQVNDIHGYSVEDRLDVDKNIAMAKKVYDRQGLTAWSVYNNGKYLNFM